MQITKKIVAIIVAGSLAPALCYSLSKDSVVDKVNDVSKEFVETATESAITAKVKTLFALEHDIPSLHIKVRTKDGVVHLDGKVNTPSQAHRVIEIAQGVRGVNDVDDAKLIVSEDNNSYLKDAMVTARVKGKILQLAENGQIGKGYNLNVSTSNGEVHIKGKVNKRADIAQIEKTAGSVKNVERVFTNIETIK
jgi:osmotically-inducible protein OsmY